MSDVIYFELKVFLIFMLHGAGILMCNDLLNSWRAAIPHGVWWIGFEDAVFWMTAGIWTFVLIFLYQDGILRLYMAVAAGLGMFFYRKTLSPWIVRGVSGLLILLVRFISRFFQKIDIIRQKTIAKIVERE